MEDPGTLDARATRFDDGVVAVLLLAAFVFDVDWLVAVATLEVALGAVFGRMGAPLVRAYEELFAQHFGTPQRFVDLKAWRVAQTVTAVLLGFVTLLIFGPAASVGWLLTLVIAMITALDAVAGISIPRWAYRRWVSRS